jgi:hypothetical protein
VVGEAKEAMHEAKAAFLKSYHEDLPKIEDKVKSLKEEAAPKAKEKLEAFKKKLEELKEAAPDKWESLKEGVRKKYEELKKSVETEQ